MDRLRALDPKIRLTLIGVIVVGASLAGSLGFTHIAFTLFGDADYRSSMLVATVIPLLVAPAAYGWVARLTWQLERSNALLDRLAHTDPLTGIANRRSAMLALRDWTGAGQTVSAAMADIDWFKRINDRFGHDAGDACIIHVASTMVRLLPAGWLVARMGGEEFLIAAPDVADPDFAAAIDAVRRTLADVPLITAAGPYRVTASFGHARAAHGDGADDLLRRADAALYDAKGAGRNCVKAAG